MSLVEIGAILLVLFIFYFTHSRFVFLFFPPSRSVQDYFVRLANQKKGMLASTHLVLQSPEGTKYQAAKKWGLPAVTMHWILGSARTGRRAEEGLFLVDQPTSLGSKKWHNSSPLFGNKVMFHLRCFVDVTSH